MANDEWFFAENSKIRDADGRPVGHPNVSGRFEDYQVVDGAASKAQRKNVYRTGIILYSKIHVGSNGAVSNEMTGRVLDFVAYPEEAANEAILRFPDAWKAYQKYRTAPPQEGEYELLMEIHMEDTVKKVVAKKRGPKPKTADNKVVPLKSEVA